MAGHSIVPETLMVRVGVVAEVALYRNALAELISRSALLQLVGTARDVNDALELVRGQRPSVLVVDMASPHMVQTVRVVKASLPAVRVVAFAVLERPDDLVRCAEAGAAAFVARDAPPEALLNAVECASRDELHCSPRAAAMLFSRLGSLIRRGAAADVPSLTDREQQIAQLMSQALSNKEIAVRLRIEVSTVKNHVHRILGKLGVTRRSDAAQRIRALGLSSLEL